MNNPNAPSFLQVEKKKKEDLDIINSKVNPNAPSFLNQKIETNIEQPTLRDQEVKNYL
jgi:hypothetical protein